MPSINVDIGYPTNRKTVRLCGLLGPDADVIPIRLWLYAAVHHPADGHLIGYTDIEIESICRWRGTSGECLAALLTVGLLKRTKRGVKINDWTKHESHLLSYSERARNAANSRWDKEKQIMLQALHEDAKSNAIPKHGKAPHVKATTTIPPPPVASALISCGVLGKALVGAGGEQVLKNAGAAYHVLQAFDEIQQDKSVKNAAGVLLSRLKSGPLPRVPLNAETIVRLAKRWPVKSVADAHVNGSTVKFTSGNRLVIGDKTIALDGLDPSQIEFGEA